MTGEELVKRAREPMTTPIDELAGIGPFTEGEEQAVRDLLEWPGPNWSDAKSLVLLGYLKGALATLDAARSTPVPASNVSEGLPTAGFAADRPTGPRTMKGHALVSSLRRRLRKGAIDYDAWIRDIEAEAAALAHAAPEGLDVLDRADNLARFAGRYLAGDSDIQPEDVRAAIDDYWLHRQPDATEEAGR